MEKMIPNVGKLAGRTVFITGASRGIGKTIALKCAKDGANIVIAAKTAQPHPKLPGTIFTAAKEVEAAGGQCLACEVDIRNEEQVIRAVDETVKKFGGIDILINNASAISLTNTTDTPMKRFDLMNGVNMRGTYICSKYCIPHLKKGTNPHILNISPPLNMNAFWFKDHVAYTMAKYGMSMCTLGMAEELRASGIAVNSLWPKTAIYTAAMEMLGGGGDVKEQCRSPDIMADAAYAILTRESRSYSGKFAIDEEILKEQGVKDFSAYNYVDRAGGHVVVHSVRQHRSVFYIASVLSFEHFPHDLKAQDPKLLPDFFLDESSGLHTLAGQPTSASATPPAAPPAAEKPSVGSTIADPDLAKTFTAVQSLINADLVKGINAVYVFDLKDSGSFYLDLKNGAGGTGAGSPDAGTKVDVTMTLNKADFVKMFAGQMNPTSAFMTGRLKIKGDLGMAMKLEKLLKKLQPKL